MLEPKTRYNVVVGQPLCVVKRAGELLLEGWKLHGQPLTINNEVVQYMIKVFMIDGEEQC